VTAHRTYTLHGDRFPRKTGRPEQEVSQSLYCLEGADRGWGTRILGLACHVRRDVADDLHVRGTHAKIGSAQVLAT